MTAEDEKRRPDSGRKFRGRMASVVKSMRRIRVLVVDDHGLMIEAVRLALQREPDIEIVGEARRGCDVLPEVARRQPDVVLLDIRMPDADGLDVLEQLGRSYARVKVVMLSAIDDPAVAEEALRRGAVAYLDKRTDPATLAGALRRIAAGEATRRPMISPRRAERGIAAAVALTARESDIVSLLAEGRSNADIARELFVSEPTVKYHLTNVYRKLGVQGRAGAIRFWFEHVGAGNFDSVG